MGSVRRYRVLLVEMDYAPVVAKPDKVVKREG